MRTKTLLGLLPMVAGVALLAGCKRAERTEWLVVWEGNTLNGEPLPDMKVQRGQTIILGKRNDPR